MKQDYIDIEGVRNNIEEILTAELKGLLPDDKIYELIQRCGTDMSLMERFIAKYVLKIDIKEEFNIDVFKKDITNEIDFDQAFKVLKFISIFEHVGFKGYKEKQLQIINDELIKIPYPQLQIILENLIKNKYINSQGHFIWVEKYKDYFFENWVESIEDKDIDRLVKVLEKSETFSAFGRNVVNLSESIEPKNLIEKFTRNDSLFSNYEFINSEIGSNLALHFGETIFAKEVFTAIKIPLSLTSIEELRNNFGNGRRNIVWLLEKMCYLKETAPEAMELIFRLALSENENISNNATNQFVKLFQPRLAETILNLDERWLVLMDIEEKYGLNDILLNAYNKILQVDNYIGNITTFGPKREEYKRFDNDNIIDQNSLNTYFDNSINKLGQIISDGHEPYAEKSKEILINKFYDQYFKRSSNKMLDIIMIIILKERGLNIKLRQIFERVLFDDTKYLEEKLEPIKEILKVYKPSTILEELEYKIINPAYKNKKAEFEWRDISKEEAETFALKLIKDDNQTWLEHIKNLLIGNQRQTYAFGVIMGELFPEPNKLYELVTKNALEINPSDFNPTLIAGIVTGKNDDKYTRMFIDRYIREPSLRATGMRLTRLLKENLIITDLKKLLPYLKEDSEFFIAIEYLNASSLSNHDLKEIVTDFVTIDKKAYSFSLEILWDVIKKENERWLELKPLIRNILLVEGIFDLRSFIGLGVHVEELIKRLSNDDITDSEIQFFIKELLKGYEKLFVDETILNIMLFHFLENHFGVSWPLIGKALLDEDYAGNFMLKNILKYFKFNDDELLSWAKLNQADAPAVLIDIIQFEERENENLKWTSLALGLIDQYGNDEKFLSHLSSRLHNFFVSGSAVGIYTARKSMLELLLHHNIIKVRDFAKHEVKLMDIRIQEQIDFDSNYNLGEI
jgi:hypothetical protein